MKKTVLRQVALFHVEVDASSKGGAADIVKALSALSIAERTYRRSSGDPLEAVVHSSIVNGRGVDVIEYRVQRSDDPRVLNNTTGAVRAVDVDDDEVFFEPAYLLLVEREDVPGEWLCAYMGAGQYSPRARSFSTYLEEVTDLVIELCPVVYSEKHKRDMVVSFSSVSDIRFAADKGQIALLKQSTVASEVRLAEHLEAIGGEFQGARVDVVIKGDSGETREHMADAVAGLDVSESGIGRWRKFSITGRVDGEEAVLDLVHTNAATAIEVEVVSGTRRYVDADAAASALVKAYAELRGALQ